MSVADLYAEADAAFYDDDYDEALNLFSQVIKIEPKNPEFLLKRCTVYRKINKYEEALKDANASLSILEETQGSRSLFARAHLQIGISLHQLEKYPEAQKHLESSKELNANEKTLVTWLRKNTEKLPKEIQTPIAAAPTETVAPVPATPQLARVRHEWFQNNDYVTVEVFMKNIKQDTVSLEFFDKSLSLTIKMPTGSDYNLELDPLSHEILPKESTYKILSTKLEIKLKKKSEGILWGALESENDNARAMATASTSNTRNERNWDQLVNDLEGDEEQPQGDAALNGLFQNIYKNADEDTKRAMMKSFQESNGTCLSTNWEEVGAGRVETKPPEGMVARKYE